jgi:hypothetical protein
MVRLDSSSANVGRAAGLAVFCGCVLLGVVFEVGTLMCPLVRLAAGHALQSLADRLAPRSGPKCAALHAVRDGSGGVAFSCRLYNDRRGKRDGVRAQSCTTTL